MSIAASLILSGRKAKARQTKARDKRRESTKSRALPISHRRLD
jgi:hypothetical protein